MLMCEALVKIQQQHDGKKKNIQQMGRRFTPNKMVPIYVN